MSKKSFIIILGLSVVVTVVATIIKDVITGSLLAGEGGFPIGFTRGSLTGSSDLNMFNFLLDVGFWFLVIFLILKYIRPNKAR